MRGIVVFLIVLPGILGAIGACQSTTTVTSGPPSVCKAAGALPAGKWFTDVTNDVGFAGINGVRVSAADLDGDGWVDVVVHGAPSARDPLPAPMKHVLMNHEGHFTDAIGESGLLDSRDGSATGRLSHLMVFGDVDNDGDLDAFSGTTQDASYVPPASTDRSEILLNDGKGHFAFAPASGPSSSALPTSAASFVDIDRDGLLDLFVGTFYLGNEGAGNRLYLGSGDGQLSDVSASSKVLRSAAGSSTSAFLAGNYRRPAYGVTACDVSGDGLPDLLVSSYGRGWNELWQNKGDGTFQEIGQGTPFAADTDLEYHDNEFYHCWCKDNPGMCTPENSQPKVDCTSSSWQPGLDDQPARLGGNTFSTACGDLDNDGDLDLFHAEIRHWHIGESSDPSQILRNAIVNGVPT
ncbi:MAG: VCBS repeat-containing protein, partial [Polyangiaceae bacterium]